MFRKFNFVSATFALMTIIFMCALAHAQTPSRVMSTAAPTPTPAPQNQSIIITTESNSLNRVATSPKTMTGKVTKVNERDKTFAVEVNFSAKEMRTLPSVGDDIDITYTQTPGGPMASPSCCVKSSKSNSSDRLALGQDLNLVTGKVTKVSERNKTFAVEVAFSAKMLWTLPEVGKIIDITFTQTTPGGPMEATTINNSKSNNL